MNNLLKQEVLAILATIQQAENAIEQMINSKKTESLIAVLTSVQEAAISVGNSIEEFEGERSPKVVLLEEYCELLWQCAQANQYYVQKQYLAGMRSKRIEIQKLVETEETKKIVAFFPYKASMWECMESVWRAAKEDTTVEVYVVPIPYYELKDGQAVKEIYEGDLFPKEVDIVSYAEFSLSKQRPDVAFIHNPFDQYNRVTTVHPTFYTTNLKKYIGKLVYIPYFLTGEAIPMLHRDLPSYYTVDYIVCQRKEMIESFSSAIPREKFLVFGTPVADRILWMEVNKPSIPTEWLTMLPNGKNFGDNKVVMLNTSISIFMKDRERYLNKLESIIHIAKEMNGVLIVWRPHPLLHATAQTMGPYFERRLQELETFFLENKIGILDKTPDVGVTVALCDAYLGETASSLIHMFGVAAKPRFYIRLSQSKTYDIGKNANTKISCRCVSGDREYYILEEYGWVVECNNLTKEKKLLFSILGHEYIERDTQAYRNMKISNGVIYIYPNQNLRQGVVVYYQKSKEINKIYYHEESIEGNEIWMMDCSPIEMIDEDENIIAELHAVAFAKGNRNHTWQEDGEHFLEDYFYFLKATPREELKGQNGQYKLWIENLDGSCGKKIYEEVIGNE